MTLIVIVCSIIVRQDLRFLWGRVTTLQKNDQRELIKSIGGRVVGVVWWNSSPAEEKLNFPVNKYWCQGSSGWYGGRREMKRWISTILSSWQSGGVKVFRVWGFYLSSDCQPVSVKQMDKMSILYFYFCFFRFLFIFGWLRVAETLYNPFGEDDEDFELNELLNRHFRGNYNGFQILTGYPIERLEISDICLPFQHWKLLIIFYQYRCQLSTTMRIHRS